MVNDFFQANYVFSHRFCSRTKLFVARTEYVVVVQNIIRVQNPLVYVKMCFVRGHVHNNIACVQKYLYPFYMFGTRTESFICVPNVLYVHNVVYKGVLFAYNMFYMRTKSGFKPGFSVDQVQTRV